MIKPTVWDKEAWPTDVVSELKDVLAKADEPLDTLLSYQRLLFSQMEPGTNPDRVQMKITVERYLRATSVAQERVREARMHLAVAIRELKFPDGLPANVRELLERGMP